jgi:hypothetical protein
MTDADRARIVAVRPAHYPAAQGIYLFGSQVAGTAWTTCSPLAGAF